eukprot:TRINITY_DN6828_c0_g1_i2.p1 TRINITY_DN6828_c0_g1~~TRINITY_DN6828_c0_g1_i2.p1  ORF type:complete len:447 (-),score=68.38 TRINITY_DN6828_c0_g1_i2:114-1421(-)
MATLDEAHLATLSKEELIQIILANPPSNKRAASGPLPDEKPTKRAKTEKKQYKKGKDMDWSRYSTRHVALKILYLGWDYYGLAMQTTECPVTKTTPETIESHLLASLRKTRLIPENSDFGQVNYSRSGRTDKGVSAYGQVVALHLRSTVKEGEGLVTVGTHVKDGAEEIDYVSMLNRTLPHDIRVLGWTPVSADFSARFNTTSRTYKYLFMNPNKNIDIPRMLQAGKSLEGEHDFRNFCKLDPSVTHWIRAITSVDIHKFSSSEIAEGSVHPGADADCYVCTIKGSGFLWHQIRCIMYILFLVGIGKEDPQIVADLLDVTKNPRKPCYNLASDIPLVLFDCSYEPELNFNYSSHKDTQYTVRVLKEKWEQMAIKSSMLRLMINSINAVVPTEVEEQIPMERLLGKYMPLMSKQKEAHYQDKKDNFQRKLDAKQAK